MSMSDPIADMLTRIRNANQVKHPTVDVPASRLKEQICSVLKREGYITDFSRIDDAHQGILRVSLKYQSDGSPVMTGLKRVSKPSLRVYTGRKGIQQVRSGLGISIITTSKGVMTGKEARREHVGGEVLCEVW